MYPCDLLLGSLSAQFIHSRMRVLVHRSPEIGVACQTLFSIQDTGVSNHKVVDSGSLRKVGVRTTEKQNRWGHGKRRTRECQAFQPEWSGKLWLMRKCLLMEGRGAGQVSGERGLSRTKVWL